MTSHILPSAESSVSYTSVSYTKLFHDWSNLLILTKFLDEWQFKSYKFLENKQSDKEH